MKIQRDPIFREGYFSHFTGMTTNRILLYHEKFYTVGLIKYFEFVNGYK